MSEIKFFTLEKQHKSLHPKITKTFNSVLKKGNFILGRELGLFEKEFAKYCGAKYAIGVGSGTEALHLALVACGIGNGDEVVTVPNSYIATALAISYSGAKPVFVDIREDIFNIDCDKLEELIRKKRRPPKAIMPVHLYGNPSDMKRIMRIAKEYNIKVIEDACQAHGAAHNGKKVGTFGDAGCFSFYPTKNLGGLGDGGIVITNSRKIYEKLLLLRNYGQKKRYYHYSKGFNSRLDEIQAAILRIKLRKLERLNNNRRKKAHYYNIFLRNTFLKTPFEAEQTSHVYHLYVIRTRFRDRLQNLLKNKGIQTLIHYPIPIHLQKAYKDLGYSKGSLPIAEKSASEILSLPLYPEIKVGDIEKVANAIREFH